MSSPFNPTVFSSSLPVIMSLQSTPYPSLRIPIILPFLRTALLALPSTLTTEGLFRIPGDYDQVMWVRERIDRGRYELLQGEVEDPAVLCSVFKGWLRELEEPLIPEERYDEALRAAAVDADAGSQLENGKSGCCELVETLPKSAPSSLSLLHSGHLKLILFPSLFDSFVSELTETSSSS
jgi:hypothetical protein